MPVYDSAKPMETTGTTYVPVDGDVYLMEIIENYVGISRFKDDNGNDQREFVILWKHVSPLQHPESPNVEYRDRCYWRCADYYGDLKAGGPSRLKEIIERFQREGDLPASFEVPDPENGLPHDKGPLIGIRRRVSLSNEPITKGENVGKRQNKVAMICKKDGVQAPAPRPVNVATSTVGMGIRPNLDDADNIVPKGGYAPTKTDYDDMNTKNLRAMAHDLAPQAGRFYEKMTDWDDLGRSELVERLGKMQSAITNGKVMDEEPELAF